MSLKPLFPVGINVFVVRNGKLLLGKRKGAAGAGSWGLPGGHLEYGERMVDAAARELMEETGLRAESFTFDNLVNDWQDNRQAYLNVGFVANGVKGEPELKEPDCCEEWRWFALNALPEPLFFGHVEQIHAYQTKRKFTDHP